MKYMGSKARLAKEILPIILSDRASKQYYVEPFAGGMNMIDKVGGNRVANDINYYLIEMWKALVYKSWKPTKITKEFYNDVRSNKESYEPHIVGWAGFNCSYSGKYFGGFAGDTKTKIGTVRDYQSEAINNTLKQVDNLKDVIFKAQPYQGLQLPPNSIIYCDPPYEGTTKYANEFNHNIFWDWVRNKNGDGHKVYVSEYGAPSDFECIWSKEVKSSLSSNGESGGNKVSTEKLYKMKS